MYNLFLWHYFPPLFFQLKDFWSKKMTLKILHFFLHDFDDLRILIKDVFILFFYILKEHLISFPECAHISPKDL